MARPFAPRPGQDAPQYRFEGSVHPGVRDVALARTADLDLDRLPAPAGEVRVLLDPAELAALLERGYEVRLSQAVAVRPLDAALVVSDEDAVAWLEDRVAGIARHTAGEDTTGEEGR